jgi:hypothetical protein
MATPAVGFGDLISMALVVAQSSCLSFERGEDHNPRLTRPSEQV